jgi:hypothetical protein
VPVRGRCYDAGNDGENMKAKLWVAGRSMWQITMSVLMLAVSGGVCDAQEQVVPPTDTDLKAAYCVTAKQEFLGGLRQMAPKIDSAQPGDSSHVPASILKQRDLAKAQLQHLQRYLLPRTQFVDVAGLQGAMAQSKQDSALINSAEVNSCTDPCAVMPRQTEQDVARFSECLKTCAPGTFTRLWSCNDLSWLPF